MIRRRSLFAAAALAAALAFPAWAQVPAADTAAMRFGRAYTQWFYAGKDTALWGGFSPLVQERYGRMEVLAGMRRGLEEWGPEQEVVSERVDAANGYTRYTRVARHASGDRRSRLTWVTDTLGMIWHFEVEPIPQAVPSEFEDYQTRTALRLPFDGEWSVWWGGRTFDVNVHVLSRRGDRFGYDFRVERDGAAHTGDGRQLEQYHCWGLPVLAPADGRVVAAVDGTADAPPAQSSHVIDTGNHVMLDHGSGEFSVLSNLRNGSVAVRAGDAVSAGQKLGECGNSGNHPTPLVHYHLQNSARTDRRAVGVPAQFTGYVADGVPVARGEPVKGQTIRPQ